MSKEIPEPYLACFRSAILETFSAFWGAEPSFREEDCEVVGEVVIGLVSFSGPIPLSMILCIPKDDAAFVCSKFTRMDIEYKSADMIDAIGELANVVAGDVSHRLRVKGLDSKLSLPVAARGMVELLRSQRSAVLGFGYDDIRFWLRVVAGAGEFPAI